MTLRAGPGWKMWLNSRGSVRAKIESALGRGRWPHTDWARPCWRDWPRVTSDMSPLPHVARPELKSQRSSWTRHFRGGQWGPEPVKPNAPFVEVRWILRHQKIRPIPCLHSHYQREGEWRLEYLPQRDLYYTGKCLNYQERDKIKRKWVEMGLHLLTLLSV